MAMSEDKSEKKIDAMEVVEDEEEKNRGLVSELKRNFTLLKRAVDTIESRYTTRVLRTLPSIRKGLSLPILSQAIEDHYSKAPNQKMELLKHLGGEHAQTELGSDAMEVDDANDDNSVLPEIAMYVRLLVLIHLLDKDELKEGIRVANKTVEALKTLNRRTMDQLAARIYFYHARFYELENRLEEIRSLQMEACRTATLRHDDELQATLLNLLLRNYFSYNLYDQAEKLVSKSTFPTNASNNQAARYDYYQGRIKALQLDYTLANDYLMQAIRKAPQNKVAAGFQQTVQKFSIVVQLLIGDIPERSLFRQPILKPALSRYLGITHAVRVGDLDRFVKELNLHKTEFMKDKTYTLILRLRHNVIKTGIRMISLTYSKISLRDICGKLHLESEEDAEFIVAKAIKDGVIVATLDHAKAHMKSKEIVDIYSTNEPQSAFKKRITFCLNLHNDAVKAMRFPVDAHRKDAASAEDIRQLAADMTENLEGSEDEDSGPL